MIIHTSAYESDSVVMVSYPRERLSESPVVSTSELDGIRNSEGSIVRILASTPARKVFGTE